MCNVGLVLEGGGMRGIYTSGVLDFLMENDVYLPYVIGVSAGACNASSYISRQKYRSKNINLKYIKDPRYLGFKNLIFEKSIFGIKFLYDEIPNKLEPFDYESFNNASEKFVIGTTNCSTGKSVYFEKSQCKDIIKVIRASSSLPLVAPIVNINGEPYLDGGISDSIPIKKSIEDGYLKNIVVLTRPKGYRKEQTKFKKIIKFKYRKYPKLIKKIFNRYKEYNETLDYIEILEKRDEIIVIRPSIDLKVDRLEKRVEKLQELYDLGYQDAKKRYDNIKKWIQRT
ncbi:patatin-like phospholipase family protein [Clostridium botulinum]|uniref:Patatin n=1 Tax=Clostridium botulinum TaxID=1491 RepID=A0A9Q1V0N8_CLOBO|nr:patatin family protein [Clostridium botulinum]AEB76641.1 Patatin-like phospholipase [Clostridium botulinum BKT015925]KEI02943.1 patatin [Clostridium botulinum D str. 16868]KEI03048.1 patatin [Clostridium botulinum C/D str. Sp77]KLU76182.1 patatin [Clostridium botulinum V891]KOA73058.1 patatin [Clostridium botulinum]